MMDKEEAEAIRQWVQAGGTLLATGGSSLVDKQGQQHGDFMLSEVLGVSIVKADWHDREHYVAPTAAGARLFGNFSSQYPPFVSGPLMEVRAHDDAQVLATRTWPWPAPDGSKFSSIHSNPPWRPTAEPEIVLHTFGRGQAVYCASLIENVDGLSDTFLGLVRLLGGEFCFEAEAPPVVEMTVFHQPERHRYLVSLVNFQKDLPNIPIDRIIVRMRPGDEKIHRVVRLPDGKAIEHRQLSGVVSFAAERLETLGMYAVETM